MAKRKKTGSEDLPEETQKEFSSSDEHFGLPEIELEPLESSEPVAESQAEETPQQEFTERPVEQEEPAWDSDAGSGGSGSDTEYVYTPPPPEPIWPKLVMALVILLVVGGGAWYLFSYRPAQKAEAERIAREAEERNAAERRIAEERRAAEERKRREEEERRRLEAEANAKPAEGAIEVLNERTGRYYVVISSALDGDLTMDYAKKLSKDGISTKMLTPNNRSKFTRLAIADYDTWAEAQAFAESQKGSYGDAVWVVKY